MRTILIALALTAACGTDDAEPAEHALDCTLATIKDDSTACLIRKEGLLISDMTQCVWTWDGNVATNGQCIEADETTVLVKSSWYLNGQRGAMVELAEPESPLAWCVFRECE